MKLTVPKISLYCNSVIILYYKFHEEFLTHTKKMLSDNDQINIFV